VQIDIKTEKPVPPSPPDTPRSQFATSPSVYTGETPQLGIGDVHQRVGLSHQFVIACEFSQVIRRKSRKTGLNICYASPVGGISSACDPTPHVKNAKISSPELSKSGQGLSSHPNWP
jgi:hypothetical protein